jgi:MYXO-CTERM domain-containing protein
MSFATGLCRGNQHLPLRLVLSLPRPQPSESPMFALFTTRNPALRTAAGIATLLAAAAAHAGPLTVSSYSMPNGASGNYYGYGDNGYPGSNASGAFLSGGTGDLTDGVLGGNIGSTATNWVPYVLWQNTNPTITFDLGSTQSVNRLSGHFLAFGQVAVYLPDAARISYSLDNINYFGETLVDFVHTPVSPSEQRWLTLATAAQQARYVQVQWLREPGNQWMALSEVALSFESTGGSTGVPEPTSAALALAALGALAPARRRQAG